MGIPASVMGEVFWEVVESIYDSQGHLINSYRKELMAERAPIYDIVVHEEGAPLANCVGLIDCTKTKYVDLLVR